LAAAAWLGGLLELIFRRQDRSLAARRFGPVGLGAVVLLVITGIWNVRVHTGGKPLAGSYEHVLALKLSLVVVAVAVGAVAHRQVRHRRATPSRHLVGGEAGLLAAVVAAAAVLTALPAAAAIGPKVSVLRGGGRITVRSGGRAFTASGPGADECASHAVGVLLAGGDPRRLPCSTNNVVAPQLGHAFASFLADNRVASVVVVADDSARSQQMTVGFAGEVASHGIHVDVVQSPSGVRSWGDAVVVTSGWAMAKDVVPAIDAAPSPPLRGVYLAPWLLSSEITGAPTRVQLAVGLPFDPSASAADAYLAQLARRAPGATASAAGFDGWLAGRGQRGAAPTAIQFFTPARIEFLPPSLSAGHDDLAGPSWVSGGRMAAVSGLERLAG
jgi:hypothetical protein